ncbi:MAG TPA: response regulator [Thermoanaerobaculia bacterium]|nr:response regulator [Thermoanaerobaculia bacterium]
MNESERSEPDHGSAGVDPASCRPAVLVVDDEETILFALEDYLTATGWRVATATTARRAVELLACGPFAAAVVDLRLSADDDDCSGLEVVGEIRRRWPATRVVLLTAYGARGVEAEAERLGVSSLLAKPLPLPDLDAQLRELLAAEN